MFDEYYPEYEPSLADEIFKEASDKLFAALKENTVARVAELTRKNERLEKRNAELQENVIGVAIRETNVLVREQELEREAKRMTCKEFMGQRSVIMYRAAADYRRPPLCGKCDNGWYPYKTPLGNDAQEACPCTVKKRHFMPEERLLYEMDKSGRNLRMWFRPTEGDGWSGGVIVNAFYNGEEFGDLDRGIHFENQTDCQAFCEYLNGDSDK